MTGLLKTCTNLLKFVKPTHINNSWIHTSSCLDKKWNNNNTGPQKWLQYNKTIFPPQLQDEPSRPAVSIIINIPIN